MKRPVLSLLLAAAILLAGPLAVQEKGWLHLGGTAEGMGSQPASPPGQSANLTETTRPDQTNETANFAPEPVEHPPDKEHAGQDAIQAPKDTTEFFTAEATDKPWRASPRSVRDPAEESRARSDRPPPGDARDERRPPNGVEGGPTARARDSADPADVRDAPIRLFGTVAFRGNFNALPKWKRVLSRAEAQVHALNTCAPGQKGCPPGAASWQRILRQARDLPIFERLKTVNAFFNKWPYRLDQDAYGASDWWATPQEFLKLSGDCEDFAITKYFALKELGVPVEDMRVVVLQDRIRGIAHAVLAVFVGTEAYVLDNVSSVVFPHGKYRHYVPYYSLNEKYRWSHIPLDKKP